MALVKPQVYRSSTTGNIPAAGVRQPGELWANFPDLQLGVIDASRNAQRLIAVRYFSTGANYAVGDFVIQAGALYVANTAITAGAFSLAQWNKIATASDLTALNIPGPSSTTPAMDGTATIGVATTYARADHIHPSDTSRAPLASPAFTGTPSMPTGSIGVTQTAGDNSNKLATTAYVGAAVAASPPTAPNPNRLDNGDMYVDQHNAGASVAVGASVNVFAPDRWATWSTKAKFTVGQNYATALKAPNFPYFLGVQTTGTGAAPVAADASYTGHGIEFDTFNDFGWGTANAQPATLSFWVNSSLTGNFSLALQGTVTPFRVFITTYNVPTANTWTKITIPIPADTTVSATNWTGAGNAPGLYVLFDLGTGATAQTSTSLGAWQNSATVWIASGAVKLVATSNAKWAITGVKLEMGSVATPWLHEDLARSFARCQRYFVNYTNIAIIGYNTAGVSIYETTYFPVEMRAAPTAIYTNQALTNSGNITGDGTQKNAAFSYAKPTATGGISSLCSAAFGAEI